MSLIYHYAAILMVMYNLRVYPMTHSHTPLALTAEALSNPMSFFSAKMFERQLENKQSNG